MFKMSFKKNKFETNTIKNNYKILDTNYILKTIKFLENNFN
jgi:hypothetical protein